MFGWDPVIHLSTLLQLQTHYLGNIENILSLEAQQNIYELAATNLKKSKRMIRSYITSINSYTKN